MRGRVLARDADTLRVRNADGDHRVSPAGSAQPGDWVELVAGVLPKVLRSYVGPAYPAPGCETFRLPARRITGLQIRAKVLAEIRRYFAEQSFLEVEPPTWVRSPGLELHIQAIAAEDGFLITSPEYAMKRLLVGGLERIYATSRCFRAEEEGPQHTLEFTMLEWYRAFAGLEEIQCDTEAIVSRCMQATRGSAHARVGGREIDVAPPWQRITVQEAFARWAGFHLEGDESAQDLRAKLVAAGINPGQASAWDDLFYLAFLERVDPALALETRAIVLCDWPAPLAALARRKPGAPQWALRFEAYIGGIELANAFDELTDAAEQRTRFIDEQTQRRLRGLPVYPIDEKFLAALVEGLPPCAGIALGVDRLAMLAAGADELRDVSAFVKDEL